MSRYPDLKLHGYADDICLTIPDAVIQAINELPAGSLEALIMIIQRRLEISFKTILPRIEPPKSEEVVVKMEPEVVEIPPENFLKYKRAMDNIVIHGDGKAFKELAYRLGDDNDIKISKKPLKLAQSGSTLVLKAFEDPPAFLILRRAHAPSGWLPRSKQDKVLLNIHIPSISYVRVKFYKYGGKNHGVNIIEWVKSIDGCLRRKKVLT